MEPVGQAADGMAASETQETPDPDDDPGCFAKALDMAAIHGGRPVTERRAYRVGSPEKTQNS